jgi:hypothetical protein
MINATEMARPFGKLPAQYLRLQSTHRLLQVIVCKKHIDDNQLVKSERGGITPATWIHEDIALDFAQWLSIDFKLWCNDRIKELLRHGFSATDHKVEELTDNPDLLISLLTKLKEERKEKEQLRLINEQQDHKIKHSAPKIYYYNEVLTCSST